MMEQNSTHLSFETITDAALNAPLESEAHTHLEGCPQCELALSRVASLVGVMRQDATEDAPRYAISAILRAFDERQAKPPAAQTASVREKIRAVLRLNAAQLVPNFGFRAAGAGLSRQFLFAAGDGTLDLRIAPAEDDETWTISGQLLGEIFDGKVELHGEETNLSTDFDSQSQFALPPVAAGNYRLRLVSENFDLEIPDLVAG